MDIRQDALYYKGYLAGYKDGVRDGANGKTINMIEKDISQLPVEAMALSSRVHNCLKLAGCVYVKDVAKLDEFQISTMRGVGTKTASEIAKWLDRNGICYTAWSSYL